MNRAPDGATNGERGRIDGPEWVRPPEVLTMVSNVETWFEHMELYFRAGRIAPERRAALVQYHTDAEVRSIMRAMDVQETDDYDGLKSALFEAFGVRTGPERFSAEFFRRKQQRGECVRVFAGHLRRLFSKAFPEMSGSADKILLQQFKAGLSADSVKTAVLRSEMDNFAEAVEVAVKEERVVRELTTLEASVASVKTDAYQEDEPTAGRVTEAAAAAVTTRKEVGDDLAERRRPERRGDRQCWKCGALGHISRECQASSRDARVSEAPWGEWGATCSWTLDPQSPWLMKSSCDTRRSCGTFRNHGPGWKQPEGPNWKSRTRASRRLYLGNHCTPDLKAGCLRLRQGNIPFPTSHAVAPVRAESLQSELMAHHAAQEAMEKMLPCEQESSGKDRSALAVILRELADVLPTSDGDLWQTWYATPSTPVTPNQPQVEDFLDEMLRRDVVEPSSSPWASIIVFLKKKDGSCRFCVDYQQLNNLTRKDAHPLLRIDDTLDALAGAQWFSILDPASGYWQAEVEQQNREKTAFTIPFGLYQFKVMLFELCIAPNTFQRLMESVLRGLVGTDCLVYLYDVIVFGKTAEEHTARLQEVFRRLREVGLKQILCRAGVAGSDFVSELRQFLGLASYYRKFVNGFANVAASLHRLLEKGAEWDWSKACQSAFDALKYHLTSAPVLAYPDFHRQFIVDVDASRDGLRAVLSQSLSVGIARVGVKCSAWYGPCASSEPDGQVARWLESLAELNFEIEHRAGRLHGNADALSRTCCTQCGRLADGTSEPRDPTTAAMVGCRELSGRMSPECSRDMHVMWQQRRGWVDGDGLIWRHRRGLTAEEGAKQALVPQSKRSPAVNARQSIRRSPG
ncbi:Retrovirus-related Pol polyprotein from transposon 17.6 [Trichinella nativa]|uniref:RNA-directed DNA polymerase n=2 Tax=Trichinella nativa TaxID=6335 RepID=A0A0V1KLN1_9BILA|nr:Retrovirus-related Pol polyprotein from transposon 17.6 [Trichinella nativa]